MNTTPPSIKRLAITGAGGGGKTSAMAFLANRIEESGRLAWIVPEGARLAISARMGYDQIGGDAFQDLLMDLEVFKEDWATRHALEYSRRTGREVVLILDRTHNDCEPFIRDDEQRDRLEQKYRAQQSLPLSRLDGVIHMVTAADGALEHYVMDEVRQEPPERACEIDRRLVQVYQPVEHRHVVGNETDFPTKVRRAVAYACRIIGIPEPLEIERKYLVRQYDATALAALKPVRVDIYQFYGKDGTRYRRRRLADGGETFSQELKREIPGSPQARLAVPTPITVAGFAQALMDNPGAKYVHKDRLVFDWHHTRWELDLFRKPALRKHDQAPLWVLEVEVAEIGDCPAIPDFIGIEREVTDDPEFRNEFLAGLA